MEEKVRIKIKLGENEIEVEGTSDFVESQLEKWLKKIQPSEIMRKAVVEKEIKEEKSLGEFYKEKEPQRVGEKFAVIAYYEKYWRKKTELNKKDFRERFDEIGEKFDDRNFAANIKRTMGGKKAWFMKGKTKDLFKLTTTGEKMVENELPRKEK